MGIITRFNSDLFLAKIGLQEEDDLFDVLAKEMANMCGVLASELRNIFDYYKSDKIFSIGGGVAIFDIKSSIIRFPAIAVVALEKDMNFEYIGDENIDIIAVVISPKSYGPHHLQRLANISRLLKSKDLCFDLRVASNEYKLQEILISTKNNFVAA